MSRIRDALRRAEQEKGRVPPAPPGAVETPTAPEFSAEPARPTPSGISAAIAAASAATVSVPPVAPRPGPQPSLAGLLESCRRPLWLGDAAQLLIPGAPGNSTAVEQLRSLRSQLCEMRARRPLKIVMITSPLAAEGKTFLTANLAHAFARQHDQHILLVDGNLRHSGLHQVLGAPAGPGLNEFLRGTATEEQILQRGPQEGLYFIPAGNAAPPAGDLSSGGRVKKLLERIAPLFDWILVDTPPAAAGADARLFASYCDGILLVIRSGATPREAAQSAVREFPKERLLGVVLNHAEIALPGA